MFRQKFVVSGFFGSKEKRERKRERGGEREGKRERGRERERERDKWTDGLRGQTHTRTLARYINVPFSKSVLKQSSFTRRVTKTCQQPATHRALSQSSQPLLWPTKEDA